MKGVPSLILGGLLAAVLLAGCGGEERTPQEHIDYALAFQEQGEFDAAEEELKAALRQSPDNAEARFLLGNIYLASGDTGAAAKELQRSFELGYDPELIAIPLVTALLNQRELQQIIDLIEELPNLAGEDQVRLLILRGHTHAGLGELDEANELYDMAMSLQDDTPEARLGKARIESGLGNLVKAREWIAEAIAIDGEYNLAWSLLGDIEQFEGNLDAADAAYSRAIEAKPDSVHDLASRALVRISTGKLKAAAADVRSAIRFNASSVFKQPLAYYAQGRLHLERKQYERAVQSLEKMLEYQPNYLAARYYLGKAHYRLGNIEQADQYATYFHSRAPNYAGAHRLYAAVKFAQGELDEAREVLENLLGFLPEDTWSLAMLADIATVAGDTSQSVEGYRRLVELYPDSEDAHRGLALGLIQLDPAQARQVLLERLDKGEGSAIETRTLVLLSYMRAQQWDEAIVAAKELLALDQDNWDAYTLLGGAYIGKGDESGAREAYGKALELRPGNFNAATNLARLEVDSGNLRAARKLYESILEQHPDEVAPVLYLNALDLQQGEPKQAQARLEKAIARHPENITLKVALARTYLAEGSPSRVLAMVQELDGDQVNSPAMLQLIGDAQYAMGEYGAAADAYEKLVRQVPDVATLHYLLGRAYASAGRMPDAQTQLQKALAVDADHYAAQLLRINLLRVENKLGEAKKLLDGMNEEFAERPEVLVEKGWLALFQGKFSDSEKHFAAAYEQNATSDTLVQLGIARWNSGRPEAAIAGYKAWLRDNPGDPKILVHLGNSYLQSGQDNEALAVFQELEEINGNNVLVLNNLAWLLRNKDPKRALQYAEKAVKIAPDWGPALDTLGSIQLAQGDVERAYRSFKQALKRSPGNPDISYHMALAHSHKGEPEAALVILNEILQPDLAFASRADAEHLHASLK